MSLQNRQIEQCTAEEVLASVLDVFLKPASKVTENMGYELESGKQKIVYSLNALGETASVNDTLDVLAQKVLHALAIRNTTNAALPISFGKLITTPSLITEINDDTITSLSSALANLTSLRTLIAKNCTDNREEMLPSSIKYFECSAANSLGDGSSVFGGYVPYTILCFVDKEARSSSRLYPRLDSYYTTPTARHMTLGWMPLASGLAYGAAYGRLQYLYDLKQVQKRSESLDLRYWGSSTVLDSAAQTITTADEWDDPNEPAGGFASNLAKFLWYFEYNFMPCFVEVTNEPTLTLASAVVSAISSAYSVEQPTKTLKQVLEDRGWTIASV